MRCTILLAIIFLAFSTGCSGIRRTDTTFSTHAESIKIVGYSIPGDDMERARELVPEGGKIETIDTTPSDWTSVLGVLGNILWIDGTRISGTMANKL